MRKNRISKELKKFRKFHPARGLENRKITLNSLIECLKINDLESFEDILIAHLRTVSKTQLRRESGLGRQTLYDLIQGKREFNPTLKTIGGLFKALTRETKVRKI